MRDDIHPHWQTEGDDMVVLTPHEPVAAPAAPTEEQILASAVPAKRHPAALVGIGLVLVLGVVAFGAQDLFTFSGQVSDEEPTVSEEKSISSTVSQAPEDATTSVIHIKANGFSPTPAHVKVGQSITFQNDSTIPHIIRSDTLLDGKNRALYSAAIFPGNSLKIDLAPGQKLGSYTFLSTTASDLRGEVILETAPTSGGKKSSGGTVLGGLNDVDLFTSTSTRNLAQPGKSSTSSEEDGSALVGLGLGDNPSSTKGPTPPPEGASKKSESKKSQSKTSASVNPLLNGFSLPKDPVPVDDGTGGVPLADNGLIPTNPYTVGSDRSHPFDVFGNRIDGKTDPNTPLHSGAPLTQAPKTPRPKGQPATGNDVWMVIGLSFLTLAGAFFLKKDRAFVMTESPYAN